MMLFETAGGCESPFCLYENYEAAGAITKNQFLKKAAEKRGLKVLLSICTPARFG